MWYGAYNGAHSIMTAWSANGFDWVKLNGRRPVRGLSAAGSAAGAPFWPWSGPSAGTQAADGEELGPSVHHDGGDYYMLFNSRREQEWTMLAARSANGVDWTATATSPVLGPGAGSRFDAAGPGQNRSVHPSQIVMSDDRAMVWYVGEHDGRQRIGLMVAERPTAR